MGQFVRVSSLATGLRRRHRFWLTLGVVGLLLGLAAVFLLPKSYQASTTLELVHNPADDPTLDMQNDVALLETPTVAQSVVKDLKLPETAQTFLGQYQGVAVSDEILRVTVSAPSLSEAILRANELDGAFLQARSSLLTNQNAAVSHALDLEVAGLQAEDTTLTNEIQAAGGPTSAGAASLVAQRGELQTQINGLRGAIITNNQAVATIVNSSIVLDRATSLHSSKAKKIIADGGSGLVAGLALGCGIVIFEALVFERLRRRDDIAAVLNAPVDVAVPSIRRPPRLARIKVIRWWLHHPPASLRPMVDSLRRQLEASPSPGRLAVVEVDSVCAGTLAIAALARSLAIEGTQVRILDLSAERLLGQVIGRRQSGVEVVSDGAIKRGWKAPGQATNVAEVSLALVTLDPAIGARHVAGHMSDAVVVVTVGRSRESRARSVAMMLEAAGITLRCAVVVGTDPDDESLGSWSDAGGDGRKLSVAPTGVASPERVEFAD